MLLIFKSSFRGREDRELRAKLARELPGIANWALAGLRRLRANRGKFTIGAKGRAASLELALSQSPALRFAKTHLIVTGDPADYVPLSTVYKVYSDWAVFDEELGPKEKRSRDDFKNDLVAALQARGVYHARRRWHGARPKLGKGKIVRGFFGFRMRVSSHDGTRSTSKSHATY